MIVIRNIFGLYLACNTPDKLWILQETQYWATAEKTTEKKKWLKGYSLHDLTSGENHWVRVDYY